MEKLLTTALAILLFSILIPAILMVWVMTYDVIKDFFKNR